MTDKLQVLREIDKLDKIGKEGVRAMLTTGMEDASGAFNPGVGLHPFQADFLVEFVSSGQGRDNEQTLKRMQQLTSRLDMMCALEDKIVGPYQETAWDRLLDMKKNEDNTWDNGGRPANIAWALDDLCEAMSRRFNGHKTQ